MPFGFVTKRQLDQLRDDLAKDLHASKALQEELAYEWAKWFNKFRSLYAMLLKREKSGSGEGPLQEGNEGEPEQLPRSHSFPRSRRGF